MGKKVIFRDYNTDLINLNAPCIELWTAVILEVFIDLTRKPSARSEYILAKLDAIEFLSHSNKDKTFILDLISVREVTINKMYKKYSKYANYEAE